jgi:hypothetical protein
MKTRLGTIFALLSAWTACGVLANAQGFNIDLDAFFGTPETGNGAPSPSFGAAAGQPGVWNRISMVAGGTIPIHDTTGTFAGATVHIFGTFGGGIGFNNPINTGDFALLLNDAASVNTVVQGGLKVYTFSGFQPGTYLVYTYAVRPNGNAVNLPILIPEALSNNTQVVTGPMPGNSFAHLTTHSLHELQLDVGATFQIVAEMPPNSPAAYINGFQIVAVPEPNSAIVIAGLLVFSAIRGIGRYNVAGDLK